MILCFDSFELDLNAFELRRDGEPISIEPRVLDFLAYLAKRPGQLFTKDEIMKTIWPDHVVAESSLSRCVSDARRALKDDPRSPRFIQTVHRRGFRFVASVRSVSNSGPARRASGRDPFIGRSEELSILGSELEQATAGRSRVVLIRGEPGIGKSRLLEEFAVQSVMASAQARFGRCREEDGAPAFWPWIQVIRDEASAMDDECIRRTFAECGLATAAPELLRWVPGAIVPRGEADPPSGFRMFDAFSRFLHAGCLESPRVVMLDDLHRCDLASLRLLSFVAAALADSRVLLVGTYRDVEMSRSVERSALVAALVRERSARVLQMRGLSVQDVAGSPRPHSVSRSPPLVWKSSTVGLAEIPSSSHS